MDNWADQRKKVAQLSEDDVVLLGSSRLHFDTNIDLWDSLTGRQPLQLAYPGSSPFVTLEDIVKKSDFKGLIVVGVSPGLFFTVGSGWSVRRSQAFIDHYYERTYAQVLNQYLYNFVDPHFAYLREDLTLTQLIERWQFLNRDSIQAPPIWPPMVKMDKNRGVRMLLGMETDTVLQRRQKDIWFNPNPKNRYVDSSHVILQHYAALMHLFFFWFESFAWTSAGRKMFPVFSKEFFHKTKSMAANQGVYNGFLAAGFIWSFFIQDPIWKEYIRLFFSACVMVAGIVGAITVDRKIFWVQAVPAILLLLLMLIAS